MPCIFHSNHLCALSCKVSLDCVGCALRAFPNANFFLGEAQNPACMSVMWPLNVAKVRSKASAVVGWVWRGFPFPLTSLPQALQPLAVYLSFWVVSNYLLASDTFLANCVAVSMSGRWGNSCRMKACIMPASLLTLTWNWWHSFNPYWGAMRWPSMSLRRS